MRSAIYYPHGSIRSEATFKNSLLLWDKLHVIVPFERHQNPYGGDRAAAWDLIGEDLVPDEDEKKIAHELVTEFISQKLPESFYYDPGQAAEHSEDRYEIWPQKLLPETWYALRQAGLTGDQLANSDFPLQEPGGLCVMSKLADACGGDQFARVTDRTSAYNMIATQLADFSISQQESEEQVVSVSLKLLDLSKVPLADLVEFRRREATEQNGRDYTLLRHRYADAVSNYAKELRAARTKRQAIEARDAISERMAQDIRALKRELGGNKVELATSNAAVTVIVGAASWLLSATVQHLGGAAPLLGAAPVLLGGFAAGHKYSQKRRDVLEKHPIAYLHEIPGAMPNLG